MPKVKNWKCDFLSNFQTLCFISWDTWLIILGFTSPFVVLIIARLEVRFEVQTQFPEAGITVRNTKESSNSPEFHAATKLILIRGILSSFLTWKRSQLDWSQQQKSLVIVFPSSDFYQVLKVVQFLCHSVWKLPKMSHIWIFIDDIDFSRENSNIFDVTFLFKF